MIALATNEQGGSSASDRIYAELQASILHGEYSPNQRLVETEIGQTLGASRTPVREALLRLSFDGLVVRGRQGFHVRKFSADEIYDIYQIRGALEGLAAKLAAQKNDEPELDEFRSIVVHQESVLEHPVSRSTDEIILANDEFHDALIHAAGSRRLEISARQNRLFYFNMHIARGYSQSEINTALSEHVQIFKAIEDGEAQRAQELAIAHIEEALCFVEGQFPAH